MPLRALNGHDVMARSALKPFLEYISIGRFLTHTMHKFTIALDLSVSHIVARNSEYIPTQTNTHPQYVVCTATEQQPVYIKLTPVVTYSGWR